MTHVSRRQFASQVSGAALGVVTGGVGAAVAADPMSPTNPPADRLAKDLTFEDHQLALLRELYPAPHLTPEMIDGIREGLKHNRALAATIRKVPLTHDVPPAMVFRVWPENG